MATTQNYYKIKHGLEVPSQDTIQVTDSTGPSVRPSLLLDFAKSKTVDPRVTFTRSSVGTYYDGKSVAKAEENLCLYSQAMATGSWAGAGYLTFTNNQGTAPDGTNTATLVTAVANLAFHEASQVIYAVPGATYTYSLYVKAGTHKNIYLVLQTRIDGAYYSNLVDVSYDLSTLEPNSNYAFGSHTITYVGNDWYRFTLTGTMPLSGANQITPIFGFDVPASLKNVLLTGTETFYVWGAQVEQRSYATAYTPTTTAQISRYVPKLQTAAANVPRLHHDPITNEPLGLLIEESRTNLFTNAFPQTWGANRAYVHQNATTSPSGDNDAVLLERAVTGTNNVGFVGTSTTVSMGTDYTYSVYLKKNTSPVTLIDFYNHSPYAELWAIVDWTPTTPTITYGVGGATPTRKGQSFTHVGNGWYRLSMSLTASGTTMETRVYANDQSANGQAGHSVYIWGPQLEVGIFPSSYIKTAFSYTGRASTGTYISSDGTIRTAAPGVARYEPNVTGGSNLLYEGARNSYAYATSIITANNFWNDVITTGGSAATTARIQPNSISAPDGSMSGALITQTSTFGYQRAMIGLTGVANNMMTASVFVKKGTANTCCIEISGGWLTTGNVGCGRYFYTFGDSVIKDAGGANASNAYVTPYAAGWYRLAINFSSPNAAGALWVFPGSDINGTGSAYTYVWGIQLETGYTATSYIPSIETVTGRSSTATYYSSTGLIRYAATNQPRYSYNPLRLSSEPKLLLEAASTNLVLYSEQFDQTTWLKVRSNITANAATAPDGNYTADKLVEDTSVGITHLMQLQGNVSTVNSGTVYTISVYLKKSERSQYGIFFGSDFGTFDGQGAFFDLNLGTYVSVSGMTGVVPLGISMVGVGSGWYRCSVTAAAQATNQPVIRGMIAVNNETSYNGNGTSGVFIWGAQLEASYAPTSYIPTTDQQRTRAVDVATSVVSSRAADGVSISTVTRAIDQAAVSGANFLSWFKPDSGTIVVTTNVPNDRIYANVFRSGVQLIKSDTYNSDSLFVYRNSTGNGYVEVRYGRTTVASMGAWTPLPNEATTAFSYSTNSFNQSTSGATVITDSSGVPPPNVDKMVIGNVGDNNVAGNLNGCIKRISFYPKQLTNAELVGITS